MKTIICDIDGTIFKYVRNHHYDLVHTEAQILPGVLDKFKAWAVFPFADSNIPKTKHIKFLFKKSIGIIRKI